MYDGLKQDGPILIAKFINLDRRADINWETMYSVVDKIESMGYCVTYFFDDLFTNDKYYFYIKKDRENFSYGHTNRLEALYMSCLFFINYYNNTNGKD
jgi:hypothetical protein